MSMRLWSQLWSQAYVRRRPKWQGWGDFGRLWSRLWSRGCATKVPRHKSSPSLDLSRDKALWSLWSRDFDFFTSASAFQEACMSRKNPRRPKRLFQEPRLPAEIRRLVDHITEDDP